MNKRQTGFTLIELVMVIVILGILAALAVPRFVEVQTETKIATIAQNEGAAKSAFAAFIAENKTFPTPDELHAFLQDDQQLATGKDSFYYSIAPQTANAFNYRIPLYANTDCNVASSDTDAAATTGIDETKVVCIGDYMGIAEVAALP